MKHAARSREVDIRIAKGVAEKLRLRTVQDFYRWLETVSVEDYLRVALPVYEDVQSRNYEPERLSPNEDAASINSTKENDCGRERSL